MTALTHTRLRTAQERAQARVEKQVKKQKDHARAGHMQATGHVTCKRMTLKGMIMCSRHHTQAAPWVRTLS